MNGYVDIILYFLYNNNNNNRFFYKAIFQVYDLLKPLYNLHYYNLL